jgi:hypothetical protein
VTATTGGAWGLSNQNSDAAVGSLDPLTPEVRVSQSARPTGGEYVNATTTPIAAPHLLRHRMTTASSVPVLLAGTIPGRPERKKMR